MQRVLVVDDDTRVLDGLRRNLHGRYIIDVAVSGADGLGRIRAAAQPYAVALADLMMPGMDGAEFLGDVHALSPDTTRMILSGQPELTTAIAAVNHGNLFRLLTKPCDARDLARAVDAAVAQYHLVHGERAFLDRTLNDTVAVLMDVLSQTNPAALRRTQRVRTLSRAVAEAVAIPDSWELRIASMLGQVGLLAMPEEVLSQIRTGGDVASAAQRLYNSHPELAADLIRRIPRLETVAEWVADQPLSITDARNPPAGRITNPIDADHRQRVSARGVYATVMAFVLGIEAGLPPGVVGYDLIKAGRYAQVLLDATMQAYLDATARKPYQLSGSRLTDGMLMDQDVVTHTGLTLVRDGEILTDPTTVRLRHFADRVGLVEPINVLV